MKRTPHQANLFHRDSRREQNSGRDSYLDYKVSEKEYRDAMKCQRDDCPGDGLRIAPDFIPDRIKLHARLCEYSLQEHLLSGRF